MSLADRSGVSFKVKVCGITNRADLKVVEKAGADYIGFILVPRSRRYIPPEKAAKIAKGLPSNKGVIVVEPSDPVEVLDAVETTGIENVQLHSVKPDDLKDIKQVILKKGYETKITLAMGAKELSGSVGNIRQISGLCEYLLLDSAKGGKTGGTGEKIPIKKALQLLSAVRAQRTLVGVGLAGGLDPEFIMENFKYASKFDLLDFNSGLETETGLKDPKKVFRLFNYIKGVDES